MKSSPLPMLTLVKAGAGAGKTYLIQQRLTEWITQGNVQADRVLAVTFTNAAANEMRQRIRLNLLQQGMVTAANQLLQASISTIHAFGLKLLETYALEQGISPSPRQLSEAEENQLIRQALFQVQAITPLLADLNRYGYTGCYRGNDYLDGANDLKNTILGVIAKLRALGKGLDDDSGEEAAYLLEQAQAALKKMYGPTLDEEALNQALWGAIMAVRHHYPDKEVLSDAWASNKETRNFVDAIYRATQKLVAEDWKLWTALKSIEKAPKIFGKKQNHEHADLALAIWESADQLSRHPGPLREALFHVRNLINSALESLRQYQDLKRTAGLVDFGDMVHLAERILAEPQWLAEAVDHYDCLIIDEFQDTNPLQFALLRHFQRAGLPTLIVGDLKQSIMGFQGSDSRLFSSLLQEAGSHQQIELAQNWRSTAELMAFINEVGAKLYGKQYQPLEPKASYDSVLDPVQILRFEKDSWGKRCSKNKPAIHHEGLQAMVNHLAGLLASGTQIFDRHKETKRPIRPSDIAVLAPTHKLLERFAEALRRAGLKARLSEPGLLSSPVIQWLLSALQFINNPGDRYALLDCLTSPLFDFDDSQRLQTLLDGYLENGRFDDPLIEQLEQIGKGLYLQPVKAQIIAISEGIGLPGRLAQREDGEQLRANLIKMIGLAGEFEQIQPECLRAMGIHGRNAATFQVWLKESGEVIDKQPAGDPDDENAVVLSTWHASKGLEWPVVLLLGIHERARPSLTAIDLFYPSDKIDEMIRTGFVRVLPEYTDPVQKNRLLEMLEKEAEDTCKNLCYVAMTRAREQVILPWFDSYDDYSLLAYLGGLISGCDGRQKGYSCQSKAMLAGHADIQDPGRVQPSCRLLKTQKRQAPPALAHTITPSLHSDEPTPGRSLVSECDYGTNLDLTQIAGNQPAAALGTCIHLLYQTWLQRPELLEKALAMPPILFTSEPDKAMLVAHLQAFRDWLQNGPFKAISWENEVPILARNIAGQTISGDIDLLVENADGYWIVDHKTDLRTDNEKYLAQLEAYASSLSLAKPLLGVALNWIRHAKVSVYEY